ncbi:MAG: YggS family pyridoxal phosphate enzyme [Elusimicrobia bacterium GWA2_56_46]|nr:MAG: YggS family pyridoxal phosphate enzyme [Elusimicrobia bacterium GWA2_56_46]OGR53822.1 MAG: YggS family pyridoxal phosphate enzyme [Elusimicrobia bacterium GWC2_56_31]HBB66808.1 YggS family pyridoxal phosphate-dependent enzyme [Elusimicrobiota bacterium]HBW22674.1 YggS family pyridoxal phosphate-dependent enzyme [Elusimicrobiota bacterium]
MPVIESARKIKLLENFQLITEKIAAACLKGGRNVSEVDFLAVTKYADTDDVKYLVESGKLRTAGESRVQDAAKKWVEGELSEARPLVRLHFIGRLQSNKAADAVELFDWIDSVDSLKLAVQINRHAGLKGKKMPVLIQLKLTASDTQGGIDPAQAPGLLEEIRKLPFLAPSGYMAIAPADKDPETLKPLFREVKRIFDRDFPGEVNAYGFKNYLSLGMSGDFEEAVQEGSNLPRIGRLLFA